MRRSLFLLSTSLALSFSSAVFAQSSMMPQTPPAANFVAPPASTPKIDAVKAAIEAKKPKPVAKPAAKAKPHPALNSALIESDDLDSRQIAHEAFTRKTPKGCEFTGGQEIQSNITLPASGEAGFYLLKAKCDGKDKDFVYIVQSETAGLKDVVFTAMRDTKSGKIYYQSETRRLFSKVGDGLREIEWQPIAKKSFKKADLKSDFAKSLFGQTVPKAKPPVI